MRGRGETRRDEPLTNDFRLFGPQRGSGTGVPISVSGDSVATGGGGVGAPAHARTNTDTSDTVCLRLYLWDLAARRERANLQKADPPRPSPPQLLRTQAPHPAAHFEGQLHGTPLRNDPATKDRLMKGLDSFLAACRTFGVSPLFSTTALFSPKR